MLTLTRRASLAAVTALALTGTVAAPLAGAHTAAKSTAVVKKVEVAAATSTAAKSKSKAVVKKVEVADDFYSPTKLTIKVGGKVNFVWSVTNIETHNVTLISGPKGVSKKQFSSLDASTKFHFERTFTVPGKYHFQCTIHPSMMNFYLTVQK